MDTTTQAPITTIAGVGRHDGQAVTIRGWLYNKRESGKLIFPIFRDGTGVIQGVVPKNQVTPEVFDALKGLTDESSVIVTGKVRADKRAPGGYELDVNDVKVLQRVPEDDPFPIAKKEHGIDFLMENRHLWVRTPRQTAILCGRRSSARQEIFLTSAALRSPIRRFLRRRHAKGRLRFLKLTTLTTRRSSRSPASFISKPWPCHWARCIPSARRSARKNPRRAAI